MLILIVNYMVSLDFFLVILFFFIRSKIVHPILISNRLYVILLLFFFSYLCNCYFWRRQQNGVLTKTKIVRDDSQRSQSHKSPMALSYEPSGILALRASRPRLGTWMAMAHGWWQLALERLTGLGQSSCRGGNGCRRPCVFSFLEKTGCLRMGLTGLVNWACHF